MGDCDRCLAANLTGKQMISHWSFWEADITVDPRFSAFTQVLCDAAREDNRGKPQLSKTLLSGAQIAAALDRIIAGENPTTVAQDAWNTRNAA